MVLAHCRYSVWRQPAPNPTRRISQLVVVPRRRRRPLGTSEHGLRSVLGSGPLNTDDNGLLEFGSPWFILNNTAPANLSTVNRASKTPRFIKNLVAAWPASVDTGPLLENIAARHLANGRIELVRRLALELRAQSRYPEADLLLGDATNAEGMWRDAERIWRRHGTPAFLKRRAKALFRMGRIVQTAHLLGQVPSQQRAREDNIIYALALSATGRIVGIPSRVEGTSPDGFSFHAPTGGVSRDLRPAAS